MKLTETTAGKIPGETKVRINGIVSQTNLGSFTQTTLDATLMEVQKDGSLEKLKDVKIPTGKSLDEIEVDDDMIVINAYIGNPSPRDGRRWLVMHGDGLNLPDDVGRF